MLTEAQKNYGRYLKSDHWQRLKASKKKKRHCPACCYVKPLQLHHMLYRGNPHDSKVKDLMWLCADCHKLFHELHGLLAPPEMFMNRSMLMAYTKKVLRAELYKRGLWKQCGPPKLQGAAGRFARKIVFGEQC